MTSLDTLTDVRKTRIQQERMQLILDSALSVFATLGLHGATLDQIAAKASLSKPNILYYFRNKKHIYTAVLERTLLVWLDPLNAIDPDGDPIEELTTYIRAKMDLSFDNPLASRLFAMEILNGAPYLKLVLISTLKTTVDEKVRILRRWMDEGRMKPVDPYHLIFSMWSITQHYADFGVQIEAVLQREPEREEATQAVLDILLRGLKP